MDWGVGFMMPTALGSAAGLSGRLASLVGGNGVWERDGSRDSAIALDGDSSGCSTLIGSLRLVRSPARRDMLRVRRRLLARLW
jgi:hypothetical protein